MIPTSLLLALTLLSVPMAANYDDPSAVWISPIAGPIQETLVRSFAVGPAPWSPGHRGVDLRGEVGQAVRSPHAGVVTYAGQVAGVDVVAVAHTDDLTSRHIRTTYQPLRAIVSVGDRVSTGSVLGTLTRSGSHCRPAACLHWGAILSDRYVDPLLLLLGRPRLLPLSSGPGMSLTIDRP